jgi:hypothetical protein
VILDRRIVSAMLHDMHVHNRQRVKYVYMLPYVTVQVAIMAFK